MRSDPARPAAARADGEPLAILAAGGALPVEVAAAAAGAGRAVFVVGLEGIADERLRSFPHAMLKWGQIGRMLELIDNHGARDVVLIGAVDSRPDFRAIRVDLGAVRLLPKIVAALAGGGDDTVLGALTKLFENQGYRVVGAHEVAPGLVAEPGDIVGSASAAGRADIALAMRAARLIGTLDGGQAAVAAQSRVIAVEGAEGTDAMIRRVAELRRGGRLKWSGRIGVLAKCSKPQQDIRVDMPTIGARTVELVAEAGLAGIVIEPRRVMIADRAETLAAARRTGTFILAEASGDEPGDPGGR